MVIGRSLRARAIGCTITRKRCAERGKKAVKKVALKCLERYANQPDARPHDARTARSSGSSYRAGIAKGTDGMKPRLRKCADMTLDFESLEDGDTLYLDGERVKFAGENNGNVWVMWKRKSFFIRKSDPAITRLRLTP